MKESVGSRSGERAALLLLLVAVCALATGCGEAPPVEVGASLPSFELATLDGGRVASADLRGRPAVIAFWATWCRPCMKDVPVLHELLDGGEVEVLSIALDEDVEVLRSFVEENGLRYPVALGNQDVFTRMRGYGIPYTLVLDADGRLRQTFRGPFEVSDVLGRVAAPSG